MRPPASWARRLGRNLARNPAGAAGLFITAFMVLLAIFGPLLMPYHPNQPDFTAVLQAPSAQHWFGTDQLGRDILTRVVYGSRISLLVGALTVLIGGSVGTAVGMISGYVGGWVDTLIMRIVDVELSFPFILLALVINAIVGIGFRNIIISLVLAGWVIYARVARGEALKIKQLGFVEAAEAQGAGHMTVLVRHVLPQLLTPVIVLSTLQVAQFIVATAAISFLGFGIQPPTASWGNMMSDGQSYIYIAPWLITFPGVALAFTALGVNLLGDWLRDTLDPRLRM